MEEMAQELFKDMNRISIDYLTGVDRDNIKRIQDEVPKIQEFVSWFMEKNIFGIGQEVYQDLCMNLLEILKDMAQAIEQGDHVLLHDATAYGLIEYLKLFTGQEETDGAV